MICTEPILIETEVEKTLKENTQLYENSRLSAAPIVDQVRQDEARLYDRKDPNLAILHEKPEHRLVLLLKLKGYSNREIAKQLGFTDPWISQVCRQPWFQARLIDELGKVQGEIADSIVRVEATNSIFKLVELRDDPKVPKNVQKDCAIHILNMHLGKPVQRTENINLNFQDSAGKVTDIDKQLQEIELEEKRLLSLQTHG